MAALWLVVLLAFAQGVRAVTPIEKVIQLMQDLKAKGIAEKKAEEVRFAAFQQFCADTGRQKQEAIEKGANLIEELDADISAAAEEIEQLTARVEELEADVARWVTDGKAVHSIRDKEAADYKATVEELLEIVDAVERAMAVLRSQPDKVPQATLLAITSSLRRASQRQRSAPTARDALASWLQLTSKDGAAGIDDYDVPQANIYESHSVGIMKMLQELKEKFQAEATDMEKEAMLARQAYEEVVARLKQQTELAEQEIAQKKKLKAEREQFKAEQEGAMAEAERAKAEDEKYLEDLKALCQTKSSDFEARQKLRADEIEAISKAIEIISSDDVKEERLALPQAATLAQLRSSGSSPHQRDAAAYLRTRAAALGSHELALMAQQVQDDPFEKVKKMIRALITRLLEEAAEEANHKGWCDAELATNEQTRKIKTEEVDHLMAESERLTAEEAQLAQDVADLGEEIVEIDKALAKAAEDRAAEKAQNQAVIEDAKTSQAAVASALAVLREFYANAADATALVQQGPADDAPETWDSSYKGMQGSATGILGLLEVIESDFARLEAETTTEEEAAASTYKKFVNESKQNKAVKQAESEHKEDRRVTLGSLMASTKESLAETQEQLDAAEAYYEKLKPSCVDTGISYKERGARRDEEIESLKEAYKILSGEDMPKPLGA